ncbi:alpha/beta hydrolase family protein [Marinobacterium arenosum]|uniref:alpha/beta hydrolase family protein n=1 Tax=Marinobacterium arenosum TaxID=2862496 RepID=UPI001C96F1BD|nr:hypothetical protein [Marinobacterium arenosum]MBY4678435.1 hypothetical protein [Marinobacterium arenosum]
MLKRITLSLRTVAAFVCFSVGLASAHAATSNAGVRIMATADPVTHSAMKAAVFYPTDESAGSTHVGPFKISATKDATIQPGKHPLILLSHGSGGSMFSHHDSAAFLARQGYIVAAIEHPGDNFRDHSGVGSDRVLIGRNLQLSALLDSLLEKRPFVSSVDSNKIGVAGFSAGGYTALLMVGARPNFSLLESYCAGHATSVLCSGGGSVSLSSPPLKAQLDSRIDAVFVMSPVAAFFDPDGLSRVNKPVALYTAANDSELPVQDHGHRLRDSLAGLVSYTEIPDADHFVFLSPCSDKMRSIVPVLCTDPPGIDRVQVHKTLNNDMLSFFNSALTLP